MTSWNTLINVTYFGKVISSKQPPQMMALHRGLPVSLGTPDIQDKQEMKIEMSSYCTGVHIAMYCNSFDAHLFTGFHYLWMQNSLLTWWEPSYLKSFYTELKWRMETLTLQAISPLFAIRILSKVCQDKQTFVSTVKQPSKKSPAILLQSYKSFNKKLLQVL